jgi:Putative transposase/Transposase zinc-binding domain
MLACAPTTPATVAQALRLHQEAFLQRYGTILTPEQRRALRDVTACHTAALGGHVFACPECGHQKITYNSCRNRHCPQCQAANNAAWLEREQTYLLPVPYYHVVFTVPDSVACWLQLNPRRLYDAFFGAVNATLREVAANPHHLGAALGVVAVLHTWGQNLHYHPHIHCIATGGGLSCDERGHLDDTPHWVSCRPGFFLPVRVLSRLFRGKFLAALRALAAAGELRPPTGLEEPEAMRCWLSAQYAQEWVVYAKEPFGNAAVALKYLARYTHRVALGNSRMVEVNEEEVTFRYKDYAADHRQREMTLSGVEFVRRWLQHVLPRGFVKVRHWGLLANGQRAERLELSRQLLWGVWVAVTVEQEVVEAEKPKPREKPCCPCCGVELVAVEVLPRLPREDTS